MSSRENAASEWESRLRVVESRYGVEFAKVSDECARLHAWERELLTFQQSLQEREKHVALVEKNLGDYLSPFDESVVGASALAASPLQAKHSHRTPQKLSAEARRTLHEALTSSPTPHRYKGSPPVGGASGEARATSLAPPDSIPKAARPAAESESGPNAPSPARSLYSPTQADISLQLADQLTDDREASFLIE